MVSIDIVKYLQREKKLSVSDIALSMNTTTDHIEKVINQKTQFTAEDIDSYLKSSNLHFWQFAIKAIPLNHLSARARDRILLCKELSEHIKKKKI